MNRVVYNLGEARVSLYPQTAAGGPVLGEPIWLGLDTDQLTVLERWLKVETRPTGARYPRKHGLVAQYEVQLGRVWGLQLADLAGGEFGRGEYVLDAVWEEEDGQGWHRETFYGVTVSERRRESREVDGGFSEGQAFDAQYAVPSGGTGPVPELTGGAPMLLEYVRDGRSFPVLRYDPEAHTYEEVVTGASAGRFTFTEDGEGLKLTFAGQSTPALVVGLDGTLTAGSVREGAPRVTEQPRVDFTVGGRRVATVEPGALLVTRLTEGTVSAASGEFGLYAGGTLQASVGAGAMRLMRLTPSGNVPRRAPTADATWVDASSTQWSADNENPI